MNHLRFFFFCSGLVLLSLTLNAQNVSISDNPAATPDPSAMLDVQSSNKGMLVPRMTSAQRTAISNPALGLLVFDTDSQSFWFRDASEWIEMNTRLWQSEKDTIYTLNKWVGIGLDNPQKQLHVRGEIAIQEIGGNDGEIYMLDSFQNTRVHFNKQYFDHETRFRIEVLVPDTTGTTTARVQFFRNTDAEIKRVEFFKGDGFGTERSAVIGVGDENSFFQASGGNFGIGTISPSYLLDIDGTGIDNNGSTAVMRITSGNGAQALLLDGNEVDAIADGLFLNNNTTQDIILVNGGGQVGVGLTNPTHLLHVNGVARSAQATWATSSDIRAKTNIMPISNALTILSRLNPVTFNWKKEYADTHNGLRNFNYGFIAQEVEVILPESVTRVLENIDGEIIEDFRLLNNDAFVPLLIKSVQEQQQDISAQKSMIENQKMTIQLLQNQLIDMKNQIQDILREIENLKGQKGNKEDVK